MVSVDESKLVISRRYEPMPEHEAATALQEVFAPWLRDLPTPAESCILVSTADDEEMVHESGGLREGQQPRTAQGPLN